MKVEVEKQETFKPIKLTLTIESEQELCNLFHRMDAAPNHVNGIGMVKLKHNANNSDGRFLYEALNDLLNNEYQYLKTK